MLQRQGFAAPTGTSCNGTINGPASPTAVVPGVNITNPIACAALTGSNPTAYNLLFPVIGALPDKWRVIMVWTTLGLLTALASVEAGLAYMREVLLQDELATSALLRGEGAGVLANEYLWITTAAQMGMGFILPFALTFVAIPLETFVHSLRTVLGLCAVGCLRGLATALRLLGAGCRYLGRFMVDVYDIVIFLPLWLEHQVKAHASGVRRQRTPVSVQAAAVRRAVERFRRSFIALRIAHREQGGPCLHPLGAKNRLRLRALQGERLLQSLRSQALVLGGRDRRGSGGSAVDVGTCVDDGVDEYRVDADRIDEQAVGEIACGHAAPPVP